MIKLSGGEMKTKLTIALGIAAIIAIIGIGIGSHTAYAFKVVKRASETATMQDL
jgi:ABC-type dipeptide/oligopeptide/nickel transport system permease subunit